MKRQAYLLGSSGLLLAMTAFFTIQFRVDGQGKAVKPEAQPEKAAGAAKDARGDDEATIRKAAAAFAKSVEKGDAKDVAAYWTEEGEYIGADGTTIRGRAAIEAAYSKAFAKKTKATLAINIDSIRFPSKDTAIEEGYAKRYRDGSDQLTASRYSVLHVREGGKWLMAVLREWPDEGISLHDLDWLIGTWEAKSDEATVRTTYNWDANKNSIRCQISIKAPDKTISGTQIILKDPRTGQLRSWIFDDEGGFGDGSWTRDGKRWIVTATGVQADGGELTATNLITPVDNDTFTFQSTERKLDDEDLANIPPIKVTRVK